MSEHFRKLENAYVHARINEYYRPSISVEKGTATIEVDVRPDFWHIASAVHGSVYFKMLDDAAFFAVSSLEREVFVLTTSFTTYLTRPVSSGHLRAVGKVVNRNRTQYIAEAIVFDSEDREIGRGSGIFVRSKTPLVEISEYAERFNEGS